MNIIGQGWKFPVNYRGKNLGHRRGYFTISLLSALSLMTSSLNPKTTLNCHRRKFTFNATAFKIDMKTGEEVLCHGMVSAPSCWGRCDSSEVPDYRVPYKLSHHPVCTYAGNPKRKSVPLTHCPPGAEIEDRETEIMYAEMCKCQICDPDTMRCKNLNG